MRRSQRAGGGRRRDQWRGGRVVERGPEEAGGLRRQMPDDVVGRLDELPAAAAVLASDGRILAWNRDAAALLGWKDGAQPRLAGVKAPWLRRMQGAVDADGSGLAVVSRRRRDGTRRVLELRASRFAPGDLLVLIRDCTAEVARRRNSSVKERRLRQFLDQLSDVVSDHAMLVADAFGQVASWNSGAETLTGIAAEHVVGRHLAVLLALEPEQIIALLDRAAETGRAEVQMDVRRMDGSTLPAHVTMAPLNDEGQRPGSFVIVLRDLSEQLRAEENLRRSEEQLRHSQKMDAVGRLASGIAHDFNNVLTAIQGHVQFLLDDLPPDLASRDDAEEIRKAAERATKLTRQLLTFARKQPSQPVSLSPNALITEIEKLLRRLIRADVTLDTVLEDVPNVLIDPGQLEQVIVNLVVNARDAIGSTGGITIATSRVSLDQLWSARGLDLTPGDYVKIAVSDTGEGMSAETQLHIFEPFFTTKVEGTGLGLSTVYGIVKQAGGHISVYSEPGSGTTFKVYLPVEEAEAAAIVERRESVAHNGTGTVLLVEDDDAVRALARRTLEARGYAVMEAVDGEEALRIVNGDAGIDVVVTDLTMPRLSGEDLAVRIRERKPDAGIVLMSGFSEVSLTREGRIGAHGHFLEKPFTPNALVDVVREAMLHIGEPSSTESL